MDNLHEIGIQTAENGDRLRLLRIMGYNDDDIVEDVQDHPHLYDEAWVVMNRKI